MHEEHLRMNSYKQKNMLNQQKERTTNAKNENKLNKLMNEEIIIDTEKTK